MKTRRDFVTHAALSAAAVALVPSRALMAAPLPGLTSKTCKEANVSSPDLTDFYKRYIAALNARDIKTVESMIPETVLRLGVPYPRTAVLDSFNVITDAIPDYRWNIQDLFVIDDRIAVRLQNTGTPIKPFLGHEPTGRSLNFMEFASYRIRDGRFAEMWFLMDEAAVARQLRGEK
jgi:predicted ester cyclase